MNPNFAFEIGQTVSHKLRPDVPMLVLERTMHDDGGATTWNQYAVSYYTPDGKFPGQFLRCELYEIELQAFAK